MQFIYYNSHDKMKVAHSDLISYYSYPLGNFIIFVIVQLIAMLFFTADIYPIKVEFRFGLTPYLRKFIHLRYLCFIMVVKFCL